MSVASIRLEQVSHFFGTRAVLREVSLAVPAGTVFAFLGRNGMGKTTTMRLILGLLRPSSGHCRVFGQPAAALSAEQRGHIGYMAEGHPIYEGPRVRDCQRLCRALYRDYDGALFEAVLDHFRIAGSARVKQLSRGERAGLSLALTLAQQPRLLLMDDPTLGLDPLARHALLEAIVYVARSQARTIFLTSHWLADVERVADNLAILDDGRLRACCSVDAFREGISQCVARFETAPDSFDEVAGLLRAVPLDEHYWRVIAVSPAAEVEQALEALGARAIEDEPLDLESAFVELVQPTGGPPSFFEAARRAG